MKKLLSIIVPSYNMEAFLPKCLQSLIVIDNELLSKLDVIVVNDGSKDRTSAIAHEFESKYPDVFCVIDKKNGHYGSCINAGLSVARGTFVRTLDADDSYDTDEFQKYLYHLEKISTFSKDVDLVLNDYVCVFGEDKIEKGFSFEEDKVLTIKEVLNEKTILLQPSMAYRTCLLKSIGYKQTEGIAYTDNEWDIYPMLKVRTLVYVKSDVYLYSIGREGQSISAQSVSANTWMLDKIADRLFSCLGDMVRNCDAGNIAYLDKWLMFFLPQVYDDCIYRKPLQMAVKRLEEIDLKLLAISPKAWTAMESILVLFKSSKHPWGYYSWFRRRHGLAVLILFIVRTYTKMRRFVKCS